MTAKKPPLLKCPTTEHVVRVLAEISEYVTSAHVPGFLRAGKDGEEEELMRKLCIVLTALDDCAAFWDRLWIDGPKAITQVLDLGRVDANLSDVAMEQLAFVFHRATGKDLAVARQILDSRINEVRGLYLLFAVPAALPSVAMAARDKAHEAIRRMKDEICAQHMKNAQALAGAKLADKFRRAAQRLTGVFFGAMASAGPLLEFENDIRVDLDSEDRDILLALSAMALLSVFVEGEPVVEMEPV